MPRKSRAKHQTSYRVEVTKITTLPNVFIDGGGRTEQKLLVQDVDTIDLPAILKAINNL